MPILSICIPIYNRANYLKRSLDVFLNEKQLFEEEVQLYISDNCSKDDLKSVCDDYAKKGLRLTYHRNEENIGMDGNFANCFINALGKYTYLLGSDDTPKPGFVNNIISILRKNEFGILHLSSSKDNKDILIKYTDCNLFLLDVNVWITFLSANIVMTKYVQSINFEKYKGTELTQVPVFLEATCNSTENAIYKASFFQGENDSENNGGYNFFYVFVECLLMIVKEQVVLKKITVNTYEKFKKILYRDFIIGFIYRLLIVRQNSNFDHTSAWAILRKYYSGYCYCYYYLAKILIAQQMFYLKNKLR